jgi:NADH-quinone oxidoreductase subunit J
VELITFGILSLLAIAGAFGVVFGRNPLYCALSLVGVFLVTAVIYVTLHSPFLAMLQVMVYAGAIMVLFVFVIMLLSLGNKEESGESSLGPPTGSKRVIAVALGSVLLAHIVALAFFLLRGRAPLKLTEGSPQAIGEAMFQKYLIPFEMVGILLLVAIIGAISLTRRPGRGLDGTLGDEGFDEEGP